MNPIDYDYERPLPRDRGLWDPIGNAVGSALLVICVVGMIVILHHF